MLFKNLRDSWAYYKYGCPMINEEATIKGFIIETLFPWQRWMEFCNHMVCPHFGHKWIETTNYSDAVENGAISMECTRCGELFHSYW